MQPVVTKLPNGLTTILVDTKTYPTVTTLLLVGAGSRYETKENNGIAHFFEHMAFKGSKNYPNSFIISSLIEGSGGVCNAFTAKDHTGYWIKTTTKHFDMSLDVLVDMITNPLLLEEEIEREKGVIIEELNMYEDMPQAKVGNAYEQLLYHGNPLGFDIIGTRKNIMGFTRQTFTDYIHTHYYPSNAVLVVAGGLKHIDIYHERGDHMRALQEYITKKVDTWTKHHAKTDIIRMNEAQTKPRINHIHKKTEQAHFCLGFRAFSFFDQRKYALNLLSTILGGGMSSRLFTEVRERRGLCYYVSTSKDSYHDVGSMITQAGVPTNITKLKEAISVMISEHNKIRAGEITNDELTRAKESIKGRLLLSMEDSRNVASLYGTRQILEGTITTSQEIIRKFDAVTRDDIHEVAQEIIRPERLNISVIGPFDHIDEHTLNALL